MSEFNFSSGSGIPHDADGFLPSNFNKNLTNIHAELNEIYKLLVAQFGKDHNGVVYTQYDKEIKSATKEVRRFRDRLKTVNEEVKQNRTPITYNQSRQQHSQRPNNQASNEIRSLTPITNQQIIPTPLINHNLNNFGQQNTPNQPTNNITNNSNRTTQTNRTTNNQAQTDTSITVDSRGRQRDSRGRFIGSASNNQANNTSSNEDGLLKKLVTAIKSNFSTNPIGVDTHGVDPTVDAIHELKGVFRPVGKMADLALKPITGIAKLRKRNEPVSREQAQVNNQQLSLLRSIDRHSGNQLTPIGLARLLPMAGMVIGFAIITMLIPELKKLFHMGDDDADNKDQAKAEDQPNGADGQPLTQGDNGKPFDNSKSVFQVADEQRSGKGAQQSNSIFSPEMTSHEKSKAYIRKYEHYSKKPYWDVNAWRGGYASDTYTTKDGKIHKVEKGQEVSLEDAERDLDRRTKIYTANSRKKAGAEHWDKLSDESKAVATSIAYNYGSIGDKLANSIKTDNEDNIAQVVQQKGADNNGIRRKRYDEMANFIRKRGTPQTFGIGENNTGVVKSTDKGEISGSMLPSAIQLPKNTLVPLTQTQISPQASAIAQTSPIAPKSLAMNIQPLEQTKILTDKPQQSPTQAQAPSMIAIDNSNSSTNNNGGGQAPTIGQNVSDRALHHAISGGIAKPEH